MFVPTHFKPREPERVLDYIAKNGFATLVSQSGRGVIASHIPLIKAKYRETDVLYGHVSKANEIRNSFDRDTELLAIFMQTHSYISSSWYNHLNVPTWNYIAVHVYGKASSLNEEEMYNSIDSLVNKYEKDRPGRFHLSDMPEKMIQDHFKALVAFRMEIKRVEASFKLSQNRDDINRERIIEKLLEEKDPLSHEIANEMKNNKTGA